MKKLKLIAGFMLLASSMYGANWDTGVMSYIDDFGDTTEKVAQISQNINESNAKVEVSDETILITYYNRYSFIYEEGYKIKIDDDRVIEGRIYNSDNAYTSNLGAVTQIQIEDKKAVKALFKSKNNIKILTQVGTIKIDTRGATKTYNEAKKEMNK